MAARTAEECLFDSRDLGGAEQNWSNIGCLKCYSLKFELKGRLIPEVTLKVLERWPSG